uniref:mucin-5AC n=1 Tax=Erigeron canadensis TaxID=72917 RepID=UPI001CB94D2B|nr:mucin-5AC [Erigeron canadensis]
MDIRHQIHGGSPSSSSTTSSTSSQTHHPITTTTTTTSADPMHSWWESISKARSRINLLSTLLPDPNPISSLADSDSPANSLLSSFTAYDAVSTSLISSPFSGSGSDPLCNWLYDTFLSSDPNLRLVVLNFIPIISNLYLSRIYNYNNHNNSTPPSLSGFEAVLLAIYSSETKARAGKPVTISIPDLSQPSLYHSPRVSNQNSNSSSASNYGYGSKKKVSSSRVTASRPAATVAVVAAPLEPQTAIKSTKRATIVGVALDCYHRQIAQMPAWSKVDFCQFSAGWAGQDCACKSEFDESEHVGVTSFEDGIVENGNESEGSVVEEMKSLAIQGDNEDNNGGVGVKGTRILLPWELLQPTLRILGHCLLGPLNTNEVKDAASVAVRCLYARGSHDLVPQAILATRSLIQLDKRAREAAAVAAASAANTVGSNANTPSKAKKPEILLVSK